MSKTQTQNIEAQLEAAEAAPVIETVEAPNGTVEIIDSGTGEVVGTVDEPAPASDVSAPTAPPELPAVQAAAAALPANADLFMDNNNFLQAWRVARLFASSKLIPTHLQGKPEDCMIAFAMARQMNIDPLMVLQNIYIVQGKPGWMTNFSIARANSSKKFKGGVRWKTNGKGDELEVTAYAKLNDGTDEIVDATASMKMAKAEGWTSNKKYQSMPEHMLKWRSATMLIRLYAPEVLMGMSTVDELQDIEAAAAGPDEPGTATVVKPGSAGLKNELLGSASAAK